MRTVHRAILGGLVALTWSGCMLVTGLDAYEVAGDDADHPDAPPGVDARSDNDGPASDPDAADARPVDARPVDAGPCGPCLLGTARTLCVASRCTATRRVFVTRRGYTPTFGGVASADSACQAVADGAHLGGQWRAWLSVTGATPRDRFTAFDASYRLLDGTEIATSSAALLTTGTDIVVEHAIDLDETATRILAPIEQEVWTGTDKTGAVGKGTCDGWTSTDAAATATVGVSNDSGVAWTAVYLQQCSRTTPHLYCFEQ